MGNSDQKKINYESFQTAITKLSELEKKLADKDNELKSTNIKLIDQSNWKGASRNYYNQIVTEQEKAFEKIDESLKQFISDLNDTLSNFDNLDMSIANNMNE